MVVSEKQGVLCINYLWCNIKGVFFRRAGQHQNVKQFSFINFFLQRKKDQTRLIPQEVLFIRSLSAQGRKEHGVPLAMSSSYMVLQEEESMTLTRVQLPCKDEGAQFIAST